jgi:hypothetical protein
VKTLQELVDLFDGCDQDVIAVRRESLVQAVRQLGEQQAMMTAFRHAANSIGLATGVIAQHVDHDEAAKSVAGDHYFLEQIAESELRYKRLEADYAEIQQIRDVELSHIYRLRKAVEERSEPHMDYLTSLGCTGQELLNETPEQSFDHVRTESFLDGLFYCQDDMYYQDHDDDGNLKEDTDSYDTLQKHLRGEEL